MEGPSRSRTAKSFAPSFSFGATCCGGLVSAHSTPPSEVERAHLHAVKDLAIPKENISIRRGEGLHRDLLASHVQDGRVEPHLKVWLLRLDLHMSDERVGRVWSCEWAKAEAEANCQRCAGAMEVARSLRRTSWPDSIHNIPPTLVGIQVGVHIRSRAIGEAQTKLWIMLMCRADTSGGWGCCRCG